MSRFEKPQLPESNNIEQSNLPARRDNLPVKRESGKLIRNGRLGQDGIIDLSPAEYKYVEDNQVAKRNGVPDTRDIKIAAKQENETKRTMIDLYEEKLPAQEQTKQEVLEGEVVFPKELKAADIPEARRVDDKKEDALDILREQQGKLEDKPKQEDVMEVLRGQLGDKQEQKSEKSEEKKEEEKWELPEGAQGVPLPYEKGRKDKTIEELLKDLEGARRKFALAEIDFNKFNKKSRKVGLDQSASDNYSQAKSEYKNIINAIRAEKMMRVKMELGERNLTPEQTKQKSQKRAEEILKETLVSESIELNDLEQNLRLEQRGAFGRGFEKAWKSVLGVSEKYQKMPLKKKLLIAGGLLAAGATAGLAGGVFAAAIGSGVIATRWAQRALSGVGLFRGIEGITKRTQEKRTEKDIAKEFSGEDLIQILSNGDEALNYKLFELNKQRDKERVRRYVLASGGAILGSLAISRIASVAAGEIKQHFGWGNSAEAATLLPAAPENFSATYEVSEGGTVWKGLESKLGERYGSSFKDLSKGQKNYIIDKWKDYVGTHKSEFGLKDIDEIKAGDEIDFTKIFGDEQGMTKTFEQANNLSSKEIQNIEKYDSLLKQIKVKDSHVSAAHAAAETVVPPTAEAPSPKVPENFQPLKGAYEPFKPEDYGVDDYSIANATPESATDLTYDQFREAGIQHAMTDKLTEVGLDPGQWENYKGKTVSDVLAMNYEGRKWGIFKTRDSALKRLQDFLTIHSGGDGQATAEEILRKAMEEQVGGAG